MSIAQALGISRSNLAAGLSRPERERQRRIERAGDAELLGRLQRIVNERQTYGYKRACAVLNREFRKEGRPTVGKNRVYRLMKENGLVMSRCRRKPLRTHEGKVAVGSRNIRWSTDCFVFRCWDGRKIEVAFVMDFCDREVIAHIATLGHIKGEYIRDLMLEALEKRFGDARNAPAGIQWLSDNGPVYISRETVEFGRSLGFEMCSTPSYSPESNGMSEALVKTIKRDYVGVNELWDPVSILSKLGEWFED